MDLSPIADILNARASQARPFEDTDYLGEDGLMRCGVCHKKIEHIVDVERIIEEKKAMGRAFDEFWRLYPKKKSKADAQKAWNKLKPSEERCREINEAIKRLSESEDWSRESGKFIPYPATWLNRGGWDDAERVDFTAAREPRPYNPSIDDIMPF